MIRIRPLEASDLAQRVKWINDPRINRHLTFDVPVSLASTNAWFSRTVLDPAKKNFTITAGDADVVVGMCGLINIDLKSRSAELYITVGELEYQGKGVARIALSEMLQFGFRNLGLNRIYLTTLHDNVRAQALYEAAGFVKEGLLRDYVFLRGRYESVYVYSYLASDYS